MTKAATKRRKTSEPMKGTFGAQIGQTVDASGMVLRLTCHATLAVSLRDLDDGVTEDQIVAGFEKAVRDGLSQAGLQGTLKKALAVKAAVPEEDSPEV